MSKYKPEVGDIWVNKETGNKIFINEIGPFFVYFLHEDLEEDYHDEIYFVRHFYYLGKAKGSIKDLFEVKDE